MFNELNDNLQELPELTSYDSDTWASKKFRYLFERYLFEKVDQGLIYLDTSKAISSANLAAERLIGVPKNILIGCKLVNCWPRVINEEGAHLPPDQHPALVALKTGKPLKDMVLGFFNAEKQNYIWVSVSSIPEFKPGNQNPYRVLVTMTDITSQKMAEIRLNMASVIVNNIGDGILVTDQDKKIISVNDAFTKLTGFNHQDVFGKSVDILQSANSPDKSIKHDKDNLNNWQGEIWHHHKHEADFPSWTTINEVRDANGKITHYIYVFMDIGRFNKIHNQLSFLGHHDPLTKLPNRLLL